MTKCDIEGCTAKTYWLSTVDGHFFGQPQGTRCMWAETRKFKCENGHITEQGIWLAKDFVEGYTL